LTSLTRIHRPSRNCQAFHLARYAVFKSSFDEDEVHLTQSKIVAGGTVGHDALSAGNADSTL